jgi:hypothetical protein
MMIRPPVAAVVLLFAAIGQAQVGAPDAIHPLFTTVLVILVGWFVNATVLNDLADERIDRVNLAGARAGRWCPARPRGDSCWPSAWGRRRSLWPWRSPSGDGWSWSWRAGWPSTSPTRCLPCG